VNEARARLRVTAAVLAATSSVAGSLLTYAWLLSWHSWATKWYLLVALLAAVAVGFAAALARPQRRIAITSWCVSAFVLGLVAAPLIGMLIVYRISGATD
jgi:hypothetical protein